MPSLPEVCVSYQQWIGQVDALLIAAVGLHHSDLADQTWRDWYESEMTPREAAEEEALAGHAAVCVDIRQTMANIDMAREVLNEALNRKA